jgi:hypothetical protein
MLITIVEQGNPYAALAAESILGIMPSFGEHQMCAWFEAAYSACTLRPAVAIGYSTI